MKKFLKKVLKKTGFIQQAQPKKPYVEIGDNWDDETLPIALMFGFNPWKREHVSHFFPEYRTAYVFGNVTLERLSPYIENNEEVVFVVWGYKEPEKVRDFAQQNGIKLIRTEDGFVRSLGLGAGHSLPMSIVADDQGLYFNSQEPSQLESILQNHNFKKDKGTVKRAARIKDHLLNTKISKYNHVDPVNAAAIYGEKTRKRILVIGQVEEDASIKYGADRKITNNDLVREASKENPDAEIIYKPHPDVLNGHRNEVSNPDQVAHIATIVKEPLSLVDALDTIDHVYTITSLAGFEALIRGIPVTCFGMPFYAGWGLTDDRQSCDRRTKKRTVEELFAAAYLLYPRYISLKTNQLISCEEAIDELKEAVDSDRRVKEEETKQKLIAKQNENKLPFVRVGDNWDHDHLPVAYMFGFNPWKREHMSKFFSEYRTAYVFGSAELDRLLPYLVDDTENVFVVWGFKESEEYRKYAEDNDVKLIRVEDGFVRSLGLGAGHSLPMSIVADSRTLYFDSRQASDLEITLQTYNFKKDKDLVRQAESNLQKLLDTKISKYNHVGPAKAERIYGEKTKKRILVIGQVEEDASIKYGCDREITNNDLVRAAYKENPDAEIIYKPHPDVLNGHREEVSSPRDVEDIAMVVREPLSLIDSLETIDHVYTITSLAGFEALIRGISVTCFGMPFYAGWGLTDDRQSCNRRTRKLKIEELFAGAYLLYPRYISLETHKLINCEEAIDELKEAVEKDRKEKEEAYKQELMAKRNDKKLPFVKVGDNWEDESLPIAYMFGFNPWKREHMSVFFNEYRTAYVFGSADLERLLPYLVADDDKVFVVWGFKEDDEIREYAEDNNIKMFRTEDGFVRSLGLGAGHSLPLSIVADSQTLYFDSRGPSDLETLLQNYDFNHNQDVLQKGQRNLEKLINTGISKYNHVGPADVEKIYGPKTRKRILVIGQVEEDASIKYGCNREITNNDLVWAAYNENPDAEIIYKPHPDVLTGHRNAVTDPMAVAHISTVVTEPLSLIDSFKTIDHVYTITSLSGFEALIRGISVTCFGMPFYAGWGLTDDRQVCERRTRKLTIEELFTGAYLLYPKYVSLETGKPIDCEQAIDELLSTKINHLMDEMKASKEYSSIDQVKNFIHRAVDYEVNPSENYVFLAEIADIQEEKDLSIRYYEKALVLNERNPLKAGEISYSLALIYLNDGDFPPRLKELLYYADRTTGTHQPLMSLITHVWKQEGITKELLFLLEKIKVKFEDLKSEEIVLLAAVYNDAGYYNVALNYLEKAMEINPAVIKEERYFALTATAHGRRPELVEGSEVEFFYHERVLEHERSFEQLVRSAEGDICLVGDGETASDFHQGEYVDAHAVVVRFNNYSTDYPYSQTKGTKTSVWAKSPFFDYVGRKNVTDLDAVLIGGANPLHSYKHGMDSIVDFIDQRTAVQSVPHYIYKELVEILEAEPSLELSILYWIYKIQGPVKQSSLLGFEWKREEEALLNTLTDREPQVTRV
ncbi:hypothetical protein [Halobacillus litoralis]|uniref:capsular polysaccharide export protein, LipB/KpsS family n=1 Tax=Halobacillus litoralis TaxID=45668 RepID=UPI00136E884F|nr:hypothetical protein [Halobacillus litoralis]